MKHPEAAKPETKPTREEITNAVSKIFAEMDEQDRKMKAAAQMTAICSPQGINVMPKHNLITVCQ